PMGTGGLVLRDGVDIEAWREGGTGGDSSSPTQPRELPHFLEGGTPNAVGLAGLAAGVRAVTERGVLEIGGHERQMAARLAGILARSPRIRVLAAPATVDARQRGGEGAIRASLGLVAFTIEGFWPQEAAAILDERFGVAVRAGLHCAPYVHKRHGLFPDGTVRASAGPFTTPAEIDEAGRAILEIAGA